MSTIISSRITYVGRQAMNGVCGYQFKAVDVVSIDPATAASIAMGISSTIVNSLPAENEYYMLQAMTDDIIKANKKGPLFCVIDYEHFPDIYCYVDTRPVDDCGDQFSKDLQSAWESMSEWKYAENPKLEGLYYITVNIQNSFTGLRIVQWY